MPANIQENFFPPLYNIVHVYDSKSKYEFWLESTGTSSKCPKCGTESSRIHGNQQRTARDLPILNKRVIVNITQKKYFCDKEGCETGIFTETNDLIEPRSQFTVRCREYMLKVAVHVSCEAAVKILSYQGIRVSGDTLLNMLKEAGNAYKIGAGKNIGIDDWAYRRGQEYGTLICDLDTHEILEVLEGRDSESLKKWLIKHPDIEIVSRDRSSEYTSAVTTLLPEAVQIADRFHITKNLLDALNETLKGFMPEVIKMPVCDNAAQPDAIPLNADVGFDDTQHDESNTETEPVTETLVAAEQYDIEQILLEAKKERVKKIPKVLNVKRRRQSVAKEPKRFMH